MKHLLTLFAVIALMTLVSGCDVAGSRGPTSDQRAEAAEIEREFETVRQEAEQLIQQHEGSADENIQAMIEILRNELESTVYTVESLRNAPRDQWESYKASAEGSINAVRALMDQVR